MYIFPWFYQFNIIVIFQTLKILSQIISIYIKMKIEKSIQFSKKNTE